MNLATIKGACFGSQWVRMDSQNRHTTFASEIDSYWEMGKLLSARRRSPRVLAGDDNPAVVLLMQELLSSRGYDAVAVSHAAAAENEIHRYPPDLILLDVVMPVKSGYELCRDTKEHAVTRRTPAVHNTGSR